MPAIRFVIQRIRDRRFYAGEDRWVSGAIAALWFDSEQLAKLRAVRDLPDRADAWIAVAVEG